MTSTPPPDDRPNGLPQIGPHTDRPKARLAIVIVAAVFLALAVIVLLVIGIVAVVGLGGAVVDETQSAALAASGASA